jgi:hypothetical protein
VRSDPSSNTTKDNSQRQYNVELAFAQIVLGERCVELEDGEFITREACFANALRASGFSQAKH